jgi:hypothetical protein
MLIPMWAGEQYREGMRNTLLKIKDIYKVSRPGLADSIVDNIGSVAYLEGWISCLSAMTEELNKLNPELNKSND